VTLALFEANTELTALFRIVAVALWFLAAFPFGGRFSGRVGGSIGLVALGLAIFFFPTMWQEAVAAF
jgi:hypothetical protein